ncbi:hypothetical protein IGI04_002869 [Brassica rapa subsp. trilocularis]|uniref:Uncharacterized protein n=1 Tax=Brassica rapa subsp. trilocularis TaxID=1813537 RepID=A0ABQ7NWR6_BRACM|nr:hypothetical protein IGI04_002869 [Brassica rapa subsp. trilocularis]
MRLFMKVLMRHFGYILSKAFREAKRDGQMNGIHHTKRLEGDDLVHTFTRHIPSFSFRKRSLSREKSCQARDSNFSSSLTIEDGFSYASFEAVGYDFNTIELSQLVRRVPFFDSKSSL